VNGGKSARTKSARRRVPEGRARWQARVTAEVTRAHPLARSCPLGTARVTRWVTRERQIPYSSSQVLQRQGVVLSAPAKMDRGRAGRVLKRQAGVGSEFRVCSSLRMMTSPTFTTEPGVGIEWGRVI
jgi:hypothetical protein